MQTLDDCCALVRKEFPTIDEVLFSYIESVLETSGDDFENEEEVSAFIGSAHPEIPQNMSFLAEKDGMRLVVFIDYQCDNTAKRFTVSSND